MTLASFAQLGLFHTYHIKSFNDKASFLTQSDLHKLNKNDSPNKLQWFGPDTKDLKLCAVFEKMGYYLSFLHIFYSFHPHRFIINKADVVHTCIYFGIINNGTSALVRIWCLLLDDKDVSKQKNQRVWLIGNYVYIRKEIPQEDS